MPMVRIVVLPSARFAVLLGILHLGAGVVAAFLPAPLWSKVVLLTGVSWSLLRGLRMHALVQAPGAIVGITLNKDGGVIAHTREGARLEGVLMPSSFVSHRLTVLNIRPRGTRRERHLVLCCGNVNEADFRRLRIRLCWGAPTSMHREP